MNQTLECADPGVIHVPAPMLHSWAELIASGRASQVEAEMRLYLP